MVVELSSSWVQQCRSAHLVSSPVGLELKEVRGGGEATGAAMEREEEAHFARSVEAARQSLTLNQGQARVIGARA